MARRSHQKGCLEWTGGRPSLRFYVREAGKWKQVRREIDNCDTSSQKAVEARAAAIMLEVNALNNSPNGGLTYRQFIERPVSQGGLWRAYVAGRRLSEGTVRDYESILRTHLLPAFGDKALTAITVADISSLMVRLGERMEPASVQSVATLLNLTLKIAVTHDLLQKSPFRPLLHRPQTRRKEKVALSPEQVRRLIYACSGQLRLIVLVTYAGALRINETLGLQWQDWDGASALSLTHGLSPATRRRAALKTEASRALIHLPAAVAAELWEWRGQTAFDGDGDFIFTTPRGGPWNDNSLRKRFHRAMELAGIAVERRRHGFHVLRHSALTHYYERTADSRKTQMFARHASVATTINLYVHGDRRALIETAEEMVGAVMGGYGGAETSDRIM